MEDQQLNLGIGTRLQHTQFGPGVIAGVRYATYLISFIHHGIKEIDKTDEKLEEIIAENITVEVETASEVEKSLLKILRQWSDVNELVPLGEKWVGGRGDAGNGQRSALLQSPGEGSHSGRFQDVSEAIACR